jgi:hypothetical protein
VRALAGCLWLALLFAPSGLVGADWRSRGVAAGIAVLGLLLGPVLFSAPVTSIGGLLSALGGIVVGGTAIDAIRARDERDPTGS